MIEQFLLPFGGTASALVLAYFLFRKFISHKLSKDLEIFKFNLKIEADAAIEKIRAENAKISDEKWQRHELRIAVLKERFRSHQKAYSLWDELVSAVHNEKNTEVVLKCQEWWIKNNLYLEPEVREAFRRAYHSAHLHPSFLAVREIGRPIRDTDLKNIEDNWKRIMEPGQKIIEAVNLPLINEIESPDLNEEDVEKLRIQ